uniref:F-box domain-containing protein n=1 Tax=Parastrongyloides trichosuri TaxID=131310 RepID=A0A0N4ZS01_PARTI
MLTRKRGQSVINEIIQRRVNKKINERTTKERKRKLTNSNDGLPSSSSKNKISKVSTEKQSKKRNGVSEKDQENFKTILFHKHLVTKIARHITIPKDRYHFSLINSKIYDSIKETPFVGPEILNNRRLLIELFTSSFNSAGGTITVSIADISQKFVFFDCHSSDGNFSKMVQFCKYFKNQIQQICIEKKIANGKFTNYIQIGWLPILLQHINKENFPNFNILSFSYISFRCCQEGSYGEIPIDKVCFHECEFGTKSPFIFPNKMAQIYIDSNKCIPAALFSNIEEIDRGIGECQISMYTVENFNSFNDFVRKSKKFEMESQLTMNTLNFQTNFSSMALFEHIELRIDNAKSARVLTNLKHISSMNLDGLKELVLIFVKTPLILSEDFVATLCMLLQKSINLQVLRFCGDYRQRVKFTNYLNEETLMTNIPTSIKVLEVSIGNWHTQRCVDIVSKRLTQLELVIFNSVLDNSFRIEMILEKFKYVRNFVISFVEKSCKEIAYTWLVHFLTKTTAEEKIKNFDCLILNISGENFYNALVDIIKTQVPRICDQYDLVELDNGICEFTASWRKSNLPFIRKFLDTRCRYCCAGEQHKSLKTLSKS